MKAAGYIPSCVVRTLLYISDLQIQILRLMKTRVANCIEKIWVQKARRGCLFLIFPYCWKNLMLRRMLRVKDKKLVHENKRGKIACLYCVGHIFGGWRININKYITLAVCVWLGIRRTKYSTHILNWSFRVRQLERN